MSNPMKVDPQRLRNAACEFAGTSRQVRNATNSMTQAVNDLSGAIWSGEAATAYINKFSGLRDEIDRLDTMVEEHKEDLLKIAAEYERAETANVNNANSLNDNVF